MQRFLKKYIKLIITLVLFLSMGLIAWFGIVPFYAHIGELRDEIQMFYASRENRNRQIGRLPELHKSYDMIAVDEGRLDILLTETRVIDFVRTLEALAEKTGTEISIKSEEASPVTAPKKAAVKTAAPGEDAAKAEKKEVKGIAETLPYPDYLRLKITLRGEYQNIIAFLSGMETLPTALDVIGVEMRTRTDDEIERASEGSGKPNPFLLVPGNVAATEVAEPTGTEEQLAPRVSRGGLEATFDTIVYVDKPDKQ